MMKTIGYSYTFLIETIIPTTMHLAGKLYNNKPSTSQERYNDHWMSQPFFAHMQGYTRSSRCVTEANVREKFMNTWASCLLIEVRQWLVQESRTKMYWHILARWPYIIPYNQHPYICMQSMKVKGQSLAIWLSWSAVLFSCMDSSQSFKLNMELCSYTSWAL